MYKYNYVDSSSLQIDTPDVTQFGLATASLKFESYDGGRDSKERLTQGLMVALEVMMMMMVMMIMMMMMVMMVMMMVMMMIMMIMMRQQGEAHPWDMTS